MSPLSCSFKNSKSNMGSICVFETPQNLSPEQWNIEPIMVLQIPLGESATRVAWGPLNEFLIVAYSNGTLARMDPVSGTVLQVEQVGLPVLMMILLNGFVVVVWSLISIMSDRFTVDPSSAWS